VQLPDGKTVTCRGEQDSHLEAAMVVHNPRVFRRLLAGGPMAFAECYIEGLWDTPDLAALLKLLHRNESSLRTHHIGSLLVRLLNRRYHRSRDNDRGGSRRNIAYHYDLGNDFYRSWLDRGMTYSAALFRDPHMSLEEAQTEKYRTIAELAGLHSGDHVLEIGCGWGGFMEHAVTRHDCTVTGITLSREQLDWANRRMQAYTGDSKALLTDYRDTRGSYDAIVSIEMLEAVGETHWPTYFSTLYERLKPGAAAVIQVITIDRERYRHYHRHTDFIQRYVFPGGMLPMNDTVHEQATAAGLTVDHQQMFGADYARTLADWRRNFTAAWPHIQARGFDEYFRRLWDYYLCYCETGFLSGSIDVGIFRLRKP
jgi:cyclopropane-fatty-acyl-phospholipid synthase